MNTHITVENIRCDGCANTITKKLRADARISDVKIEIEKQIVNYSSKIDVRTDVVQILLSLGYPEKGSVTGIVALKGKAKSVISCAIGKIGKKEI